MLLNFLSAKVPLTKTFSRLANGELDKSAYPLVRNFTSHEAEVRTPHDFYDALLAHSVHGHCLLKGRLKRQLVGEPRGGTTDPLEATSWSCFDLDNVKDVTSIDQFVYTVLPPAFHHVDYVLQYSASAGITHGLGLRAHLFFMHNREFTPEQAKIFFTELNLKNPILSRQLSLSANGTALRYALDRTVCQNDKLIYIAPPTLRDGLVDTLAEQRIQLITRAQRLVSFDWATADTPAAVEAAVQARVDQLRQATGMRKKGAKFRTLRDGELVLTNPDVAVVTAEKRARGFTYLNINGGDSWGYYFADDNPRYLRNFKGESTVVLADFVPTYWAQIQDRLRDERQGEQPFAFRERRTDTIWNGVFDPVNNRIIDIAPTSRQNLQDFFLQYNLDVPQIEDWDYEFQPGNPVRIDFQARRCNQWEQSEYMKRAEPVQQIPPTIDRVIRSVVAHDLECYHHFVNWLACIYQTHAKTTTAWVFHGVEGTGKGVLFNEVLMPIFGERYCRSKKIEALEDRFNADLEYCVLFNLDEARFDDSTSTRRLINKIKNMITEPYQEIRAMRSNSVQVRNYTNFIVSSNDYDALSISTTDRRFNVAPRQDVKLEFTVADMEVLRAERVSFAGYLKAYKVDQQKARTALNNDAKRSLRAASQDALEQMCQAVIDGDLDYFMQYIENGVPATQNLSAWSAYLATMRSWLDGANKRYVATRDELLAAYVYLFAPNQVPGPHKFVRMLAHKNVVLKPAHCSTKRRTCRGAQVYWKVTDEQLATWRTAVKPGEKQPTDGDDRVITWKSSNSASA
jgi:hypothetical protein